MAESFNHFPEISDVMDTALQQVPRKVVFDIQAYYAAHAARDTGFMANSAYVVTSQESTYGRAGSPPKGATLLPEVPRPSDKYTAFAAVGANYAIDVELGTVHMAAQPAFFPAVDAAKPGFQAAMAAIESSLQ